MVIVFWAMSQVFHVTSKRYQSPMNLVERIGHRVERHLSSTTLTPCPACVNNPMNLVEHIDITSNFGYQEEQWYLVQSAIRIGLGLLRIRRRAHQVFRRLFSHCRRTRKFTAVSRAIVMKRHRMRRQRSLGLAVRHRQAVFSDIRARGYTLQQISSQHERRKARRAAINSNRIAANRVFGNRLTIATFSYRLFSFLLSIYRTRNVSVARGQHRRTTQHEGHRTSIRVIIMGRIVTISEDIRFQMAFRNFGRHFRMRKRGTRASTITFFGHFAMLLARVRGQLRISFIRHNRRNNKIFHFRRALYRALARTDRQSAFFAAYDRDQLHHQDDHYQDELFHQNFHRVFFRVFADRAAARANTFGNTNIRVIFDRRTASHQTWHVIILLFREHLLTLHQDKHFLFEFNTNFFANTITFARTAGSLAEHCHYAFVFRGHVRGTIY